MMTCLGHLYRHSDSHMNGRCKLEKFAGVHQGTDRLLKMYQEAERLYIKAHESESLQHDFGYDFHCMMSSDLDQYENFLLFGFGKFDLNGISSKYCEGDKVSGTTTHAATSLHLLQTSSWFKFNESDHQLQTILNEAEGFYWQ